MYLSSVDNSNDIMNDDIYHTLMLFSTLPPIEMKILLVLAHIFPNRVTGTEISYLLGFNKNSRTIYRGPLRNLEKRGFIIIERISDKKNMITLNIENSMMRALNQITLDAGDDYAQRLFQMLRFRRGES